MQWQGKKRILEFRVAGYFAKHIKFKPFCFYSHTTKGGTSDKEAKGVYKDTAIAE